MGSIPILPPRCRGWQWTSSALSSICNIGIRDCFLWSNVEHQKMKKKKKTILQMENYNTGIATVSGILLSPIPSFLNKRVRSEQRYKKYLEEQLWTWLEVWYFFAIFQSSHKPDKGVIALRVMLWMNGFHKVVASFFFPFQNYTKTCKDWMVLRCSRDLLRVKAKELLLNKHSQDYCYAGSKRILQREHMYSRI